MAAAALEIEGARLQALSVADEVHETAVAGGLMDYQECARICGVVGYSAKLLARGG